MTSCRPAPEACRLAWIEGAATLTTEASSTAMNCPVRTTARAAQGLRTGRWDGRAVQATARVSVMTPSLPGSRCQYQEPAYPGTSSTWQPPRDPGTMEA